MKTRILLALLTPAIACLWGCPSIDGRCVGANPRAKEIQFLKTSDTGLGSGNVRIIGVADNHGTASYNSNQGQQELQLFEDGEKVASQPFEDLAVDETVQVIYERFWSKSNEFRPDQYQLVVVYDPDIYMDGNPDNDDCNSRDNSATRGTSGLDELF